MREYGVTVIGLKVKRSELLEVKKHKRYEHSYPEEYNYSPIDGSQLWKLSETAKPWIKTNKPMDTVFTSDATIGGVYKIFDIGGVYKIFDREKAYVVILLNADLQFELGAAGVSLPLDFARQKANMKRALVPLGIWDDLNFGVFTLLR